MDKIKEQTIIHIDSCINLKTVLAKIVAEFEIDKYVVEFNDHYLRINRVWGFI